MAVDQPSSVTCGLVMTPCDPELRLSDAAGGLGPAWSSTPATLLSRGSLPWPVTQHGLWEGVSSEWLRVTVTAAVAERERTRCLSRGERAARSHPPRSPSLATLGAEQALLAARRLTSAPDPLAPEPASQEGDGHGLPRFPSRGVGPTLPQLRHPPRCLVPQERSCPAFTRCPRWRGALGRCRSALCCRLVGRGGLPLQQGPGAESRGQAQGSLIPVGRGPGQRLVSA